jgi:GTP-binding protein EngB required for normal cell division
MKRDEEITGVSPPQSGERLQDYERLKLQLGSLCQRLLRLIDSKTDYERLRRCRDLLSALAADRFTLAVVGQFNRGKSSLMNAILGLDRLPVGVVPLTSVITKVSYGNPERVLIEYEGSHLKGEISLGQLAEYVTEGGNPGNQRHIAAAEIQLPSEFLRRGLFFVDTPGVGSAIAENTATTESFLPEADAVIFVTSFDSPLGREELEFLQKVREHVRKVFFAVNELDLVPSEQHTQVLSFIRNRLEYELGLQEPRLFPVSALLGLQAKLAGSARKLVESGLPALEESLIQFLTTEKTGEFLVRSCDRALALMVDQDLGKTNAEQGDSLENVVEPLAKLREELTKVAGTSERRSLPARPTIEPRPEAELMEAALKPCQVCTVVSRAIFKFMAGFQYQILVNENERLTLASRGGLCALHTWQYAEIASPQGIAGSYPAVLKALSRRLRTLAEGNPAGGLGGGTRNLLAGQEKCRACQEQLAAQEKVIREILEKVSADGKPDAARLPVLCLPHLSVFLRKVRDPGLGQALVYFEAALFERLAENMELYSLKHDALRRELQSEDERVAYHRGLSQLVGIKSLQSPWHVEYLL